MKLLKAMLIAASVLISTNTFAGLVENYPVVIDLESKEVFGTMWDARSSADANQMIGCGRSVGQYPAPYDDYGYCQAYDADGNFVGCFFFDPEYFEVIASINAYSFIRFGFDGDLEEFSNCTFLVVTAKSAYLPFTPVEKEKAK